MALWDKLKTELDRRGKAAQGALDEGKTRLEAFRARQLADKAAQALGYAVFSAKQAGTEVDWETLQRLVNALAEKEAEVQRLEKELRDEEKAAPPEHATAAHRHHVMDWIAASRLALFCFRGEFPPAVASNRDAILAS
jgi:hypothetical protein